MKRFSPEKITSLLVDLFFLLSFGLLALRDGSLTGAGLALLVPAGIWLLSNVLSRAFHIDSLLFSLTNFLCALGILVLYDTNPALAYRQLLYFGVGIVGMIVCIYLIRVLRSFRVPAPLLMLLSVAGLVLPILFGRETNGAKNWIYLGGHSLQPNELIKPVLILVTAWYMSRRRILPWLFMGVACLALLMLQKDLGAALLYYCVILLMFLIAYSNLPLLLLGIGGGAGAAVMGYRMFAHVKKRVAIWQNPWSDYENAGYQLVQGLMALASGSLFGVGLGLGSPTTIPVYQTDFIFAVICEQFGLIFGLCVLLVYLAIIWRGSTIAMEARRFFHALTAMGSVLMLGLQTFIIIGGVIKLIPLTGVTMPFVSSGGSSLLSCMCMTGLIQGVASLNEDDLQEDMRLTETDSVA